MGRMGRMGVMVAVAVAVSLGGCTAFNLPQTRVKLNPATGVVEYYNSKDSTMTVKRIEAKGDNKSLGVDELAISDLSSPVEIANVQQMDARARQIEQEGIATARVVRELVGIVREITNAVNVPAGVVDRLTDLEVRVRTDNVSVETSKARPAGK